MHFVTQRNTWHMTGTQEVFADCKNEFMREDGKITIFSKYEIGSQKAADLSHRI